MAPSRTARATAIRQGIDGFLGERFDTKAKPLKADAPEREDLQRQYQAEVWLADAARRASQIQLVTHTLKATHPDARGSSRYCLPGDLSAHPLVGSHCLPDSFPVDVVGNAAALDVYKFLRIEHDGRTLLELMQADDADMLTALSDKVDEARTWAKAFSAVADGSVKQPASHTLAKQIYWPLEGDPCDDGSYHLLAPLYASSLAQTVHGVISADRFGEEAKQARQARREQQFSETVLHEYPLLAVQKLGGTKPQNISQLNSERRGMNYLLASAPPRWRSSDLPLPHRTDNAMRAFGRQREVRRLLRGLADFLRTDPSKTVETRDSRDDWTDQLIDELLHYASAVQQLLPPGWSGADECKLPQSQCLWLDPYRAQQDPEFAKLWHSMTWVDEVYRDFALWLNERVSGLSGLPVGDPEHHQWAQAFEDAQEMQWQTDQLRRRMAKLAKIKGELGVSL